MSVATIGGSLLVATILALLAWLVGRGKHVAIAHGLWLLVLLKLLVPPMLDAPILPSSLWPETAPGPRADVAAPAPAPVRTPVPVVTAAPPRNDAPAPQLDAGAPPEAAAGLASVVAADAASLPPRNASPLPALLLVWAAGSALFAALSIVRIVRFQRALRAARPAGTATIESARVVAAKLGATRIPEILVLSARIPPLLWAVGRPRIVLPLELESAAPRRELEAALAHELAHVVRRDHWTRWIELAATIAWWWFPVLWWARSELRAVEEECCDAWAVWALEGDGAPCAEVVLHTMDLLAAGRVSVPAVSSGIGSFRTMKRRLTMMFQSGVERRLRRHERALALVLAAVVLPVAVSWTPVRAAPPQDGSAAATLDTLSLPRAPEGMKTTTIVTIDRVALTNADLAREIVAMHEPGSVETLVRRLVADLELKKKKLQVAESETDAEVAKLIAAFSKSADLRAIQAASPRIAAELRATAAESAAWKKLAPEGQGDQNARSILTQLSIRQAMDRYKVKKRFAGDELPAGVAAEITDDSGATYTIRDSAVLDHLRTTLRYFDLVDARDALIDDYIVGRELQSKGQTVSPAEVGRYVETMTAKYKPPFDWKMICQFKNTTPAKEVGVFRRTTAWKRANGVVISKQEIERFAEERAEYFRGGHRNISQIKLRTLDAVTGLPLDAQRQAEVERKIADIHRALEEGFEFGKMADQQSDDSSPRGVVTVPIKRFGVNPETALRDAVYGLTSVGEISKPFRARDGWCVVKLDKITEPKLELNVSEPNFAEWIQDELERNNLAAHVAEMRAKSTITLAPDQALLDW